MATKKRALGQLVAVPASGDRSGPTGVIGNGISLPGASGDYVTLPSAFIQTLQDITITLWVNVHVDQTWQRVFDFGSSQTVYMFLTSHAGGANARFAITTAGNTMEQQLNGTAVLTSCGCKLATANPGAAGVTPRTYRPTMLAGAAPQAWFQSRFDLRLASAGHSALLDERGHARDPIRRHQSERQREHVGMQ
jgi:Concanavalin A-like lectin/glucanases superfamily